MYENITPVTVKTESFSRIKMFVFYALRNDLTFRIKF